MEMKTFLHNFFFPVFRLDFKHAFALNISGILIDTTEFIFVVEK